jgi:hypothetical protein
MPEPARQAAVSKVCRRCQRELPATLEYFRPTPTFGWLRGTCRKCQNVKVNEKRVENSDIAGNVRKAAVGTFKPRVVGEDGPEGGYTERPLDGYKWLFFPDTHGIESDWKAISGALALSRWYKPTRIILGGDHVHFTGVSRFDKPATSLFEMGKDVDAAKKFMRLVRESHPNAKIEYVPGNHEKRLIKYLWKHPELANALGWADSSVLPKVLGVAEFGIDWVESGVILANDRFMWKHGNIVRSKSGVSAAAEMAKNGLSGCSGHTHRLAQHYNTTRAGVFVWCESGCLCDLEPDYAEEQKMDWQHGVSLGSVSLSGHSFTAHTVPIVNGRAKVMGMDISE